MRSRKHVFFAMAACAFLSMGCSNFFGLFFSHSITYHANGGIGSDSVQSVEPNEDAKLIKNAFTRAGYSFLGWSPNAAASRPSYYDEAIYAVGVCDVDLYAVWALTADCRTITYHANGGVGEDSGGTKFISAAAPLRLLFGFETELRSSSAGRASHQARFLRYEIQRP